jgi:type IV secretory pathway VirB2 component (pilin)
MFSIGSFISSYLITVATAAAGSNPFEEVSHPIISLINNAVTPLLAVVGALGAIYCIILGAKLAKAEEPQDREKAKNSLKNALIGFLLIFVLLVALKIGMSAMTNWYSTNAK